MLEPDVTTTQVIIMYAVMFTFFFGVTAILLKKNS